MNENTKYIAVNLSDKKEIEGLKKALSNESFKDIKVESRKLTVYIEVDEADAMKALYAIRDNTSADACSMVSMVNSDIIYLRGETIRTDLNTVRERIKEVLTDENYQYMLDSKNYANPVSWMEEHIQKHREYLDSQAGAVAELPYTIVLSATGLGCVGRCVCDICQEYFNMCLR